MTVHCMVVWLTGMQYLHVLALKRCLTVVWPSQAFHDAICEYRVIFAICSTVACRTCTTETDSRRGVNGTWRRQSLSGCCKGIHRCDRYPASIDLSAEEGKKEPTF